MQQSSLSTNLSLFVYGTLKRGFENHEKYCNGFLEVESATVLGDLYELPFGFPALIVPNESIRALGTANPSGDVATQHNLSESRSTASPDHGARAFGELLIFDDPADRLPRLDHLEGFAPGGSSLYRRVLIPVETATYSVPAWAYAIDKPTGAHLPGGRWPA